MNKTNDSMDSMGGDDMGFAPKKSGRAAKIIKIVLIVIIVAAVILGIVKVCLGGFQMFGGDPIASVSKSDWQAVFLVNGQVYFGKVQAVGGKTLTLGDIYYLQVVTKPLQTTQQGTAATAADQSQELTLIKLGNEIHGPSDRMVINRDQIVLTEKLKNDSRVVQAISKYVSDQKAAAAKK